jgi:signal transduction histidine kinase
MILVRFAISSQAQETNSVVDSIKSLQVTAIGEEKFKLTYQLAYELFDVDNQEALVYGEEAQNLALQMGDSLAMTRSGRIVGQLLRRLDRPDDAIAQFLAVLPIAERNNFSEELKRILNGLAITYNFKGMYDLALYFNFKSLEIREREGNKSEVGVALNNIGLVYYKIGNFEQALEFYNRALEVSKDSGDKVAMAQLNINLSLCYIYLGMYDKAKEYVYRGFDTCGDQCTDQIKIEGEHCLGRSFFESGKLDESIEHFQKSYEIAKEVGDKRFQSENAHSLAAVYFEQGNVDRMLTLLTEAEQLASEAGYSEILIQTYKKFSKAFTVREDYANAAKYQNKYIQLKDSIYSEELIKNLARVQTDYAQRENIKTISEQVENLRLKEEIIVRQRQIYFFIAALAVLTTVLAFGFFLYNRALSKAKAQVSMLNETLELKVRDRTRALQSVNNELDNFIYKTSHDIRGPLASLKGIANVALLEVSDPKAKEYLSKLDNSADKLNSILTRLLIVNQINHAVLAPMPINFEELINEILVFERKKGTPPQMDISFEIEPSVVLITDRHLLRIVLENLVDNAIKYHNNSDRVAPFVKIKVGMAGDKVVIRVIDNGIGIQERNPQKLFQMFVRASERSESGGIGLYLTKLASERLEARVDFASTAEKYTQFSVTLPANLAKVLEEKDNTSTPRQI